MNYDEYKHPIEQIMNSAMSRLKTIIDVNTVIGDPIETADGVTIVPVSKVTVGFVAGGGEYSQNNIDKKNTNPDFPFAGGSGAGFNVVPVGFLIKENGTFRMIDVETDGTTASLLELVAKIYSGLTSNGGGNKENEEE